MSYASKSTTDWSASESIKSLMVICIIIGLFAEAGVAINYFSQDYLGDVITAIWFVYVFTACLVPACLFWLWAKAVHVSELTNEYLKVIAEELIERAETEDQPETE